MKRQIIQFRHSEATAKNPHPYGYSQQVRVWRTFFITSSSGCFFLPSFSGLTRESTSILQFQPTIRCELPFFLIGFHCVSIWNSCHRHVFKLPYSRAWPENPSRILWIFATSASMTHFFYYVIFGLVPKIQSALLWILAKVKSMTHFFYYVILSRRRRIHIRIV